jgi:hypothetical protein
MDAYQTWVSAHTTTTMCHGPNTLARTFQSSQGNISRPKRALNRPESCPESRGRWIAQWGSECLGAASTPPRSDPARGTAITWRESVPTESSMVYS